MSTTETLIETHTEEHTGYVVKRYLIELDSTSSHTLDDTSWADVVDISSFENGTDTSNAAYWDGSDVKLTGFTSGADVHLTVRGRVS